MEVLGLSDLSYKGQYQISRITLLSIDKLIYARAHCIIFRILPSLDPSA